MRTGDDWIRKRSSDQVELEFRDEDRPPEPAPESVARHRRPRPSAFADPREFAYQWTGSTHYLALHDMRLADGETTPQGAPLSTLNDLRDS